MTAKQALEIYKGRDASEKLFMSDKTFLGNQSLRVDSDESAAAKIFIEFIALIIRNRMYNNLQDEMKTLAKKPNYMSVPAAIRELDKIQMSRQLDGVYRFDHAITATQKAILNAFVMTEGYVKADGWNLKEGEEMARIASMEALEQRMEKAQEQVSKTKKAYDAAIAVLSDLLDKRDALRRDELVKAIMKSDKTYEEVLEFLNSEKTDESEKRKKLFPDQE